MKKRLTATEEFEIMKIVLDKVLWIGVALMLFGFFTMYNGEFNNGLLWIGAGAIVLIIFIIIIVKEYEVMRG